MLLIVVAWLQSATCEILALLTQEALRLRDIGTVDIEARGPLGPRASCVNSANISHVAREKPCYNYFVASVGCTVKQSRTKLACCELHHRPLVA